MEDFISLAAEHRLTSADVEMLIPVVTIAKPGIARDEFSAFLSETVDKGMMPHHIRQLLSVGLKLDGVQDLAMAQLEANETAIKLLTAAAELPVSA